MEGLGWVKGPFLLFLLRNMGGDLEMDRAKASPILVKAGSKS